MKGMTLTVILVLIVCLVVFVILVMAAIIPIANATVKSGKDIDWWTLCAVWSQRGYHFSVISGNQHFVTMADGTNVEMNEPCTKALGRKCATYPNCMKTDDDWNECVNACMLNNTKA